MWPDEDDREAMQRWAPFTLQWPGLAAPGPTPLTPAERQHALDVVLPRIRVAYGVTPQARIALVAAGGGRDIPDIAARLVNALIWTFWWD